MDGEPTLLASLGAHVRETKEIESFRSALAASFTAFARIATELNQTRLPFVQLQAKLGEPRVEIFQARFRLTVVLKANHKIIRIAHNDHIAAAAVFPPPLNPEIKHIV